MKRPLMDEVDKTPYKGPSRNRPVKSCWPCHKTKRRCDRGRPCQRCIKLGNIGACIYEVSSLVDSSDAVNGGTEAGFLRQRITELEAIVRAYRSGHPQGPVSVVVSHGCMPKEGGVAKYQRCDASGVAGSSTIVGRAVYDYTDESESDDAETSPSLGQPVSPQPSQLPPEPFQPKIERVGRCQMLIGAAAAPLLVSRLNEMVELPTRIAFDGFLPTEDGAGKIFVWHGPTQLDAARSLILEMMPEADTSTSLFHEFQRIVEVQYKAWFGPTLEHRFSSFFSASTTARLQCRSDTLALICAILALSSCLLESESVRGDLRKATASFEACKDDSTSTDPLPYPFVCASLKLLEQFETAPTIESVQAQYLLCIFWANSDHVSRTAQLLPNMVRHAQMLGLHVDPRKIFRSMPLVEQETRRRLWWAIQELDTSLSMFTGLPPMITGSDCDLPQDRTERSLLGPCADAPEPLPAIGFTLDSYHVYALECTLYAREVLSRVFRLTSWHWGRSSPQTAVPGIEEILKIDAALKAWYNRIPSALCYEIDAVPGTSIGPPRPGTSEGDLKGRSHALAVQSLLLTISANSLLVCLHRPFLQHSMWSIEVATRAGRQVLYSATTVIRARCRLGKFALSFWVDAMAFASALTLAQLAFRQLNAGVTRSAEFHTAWRCISQATALFKATGSAKNLQRSHTLLLLDEALQSQLAARAAPGPPRTSKTEISGPPTPISPFGHHDRAAIGADPSDEFVGMRYSSRSRRHRLSFIVSARAAVMDQTRPMLRVDTASRAPSQDEGLGKAPDVDSAELEDGRIFRELDHLRRLQSSIHEEHIQLERATISLSTGEAGQMDFSKISSEFADRQAAIGSMMTQLNTLAASLCDFHSRDVKAGGVSGSSQMS